MKTNAVRLLILFALATTLTFLTGCGGGGNNANPPAPPLPTFSSTPITAASEDSSYSYQVTANDPEGGSVTLSLTNAPEGATLTGNTVLWTPTTAQARQPNRFAVKATTSKGGSATQSWVVTPSGTVRVSWVDTTWTNNGSSTTPLDWSLAATPAIAMVPKSDGTLQSLNGTGRAD